MKLKPVKKQIIDFLRGEGWIWGGVLSRAVHEITGKKESNIERRCRELVNEGKILAEYEQVAGKGNKIVRYKLAEQITFTPKMFEKLQARKQPTLI